MTPVRTSAIFSLSKNTINHAVTTVFINARYTKTQLPVALVYNFHFFLKLGFTLCKAEQPLRGMDLQEKEAQSTQEICLERTYS